MDKPVQIPSIKPQDEVDAGFETEAEGKVKAKGWTKMRILGLAALVIAVVTSITSINTAINSAITKESVKDAVTESAPSPKMLQEGNDALGKINDNVSGLRTDLNVLKEVVIRKDGETDRRINANEKAIDKLNDAIEKLKELYASKRELDRLREELQKQIDDMKKNQK